MENYESQTGQAKRTPWLLISVVIILAIAATLLGLKLYNTIEENKEQINYITNEKNELEKELNGLIVDYDSLKTDNDSINLQLEAEQEKIKKLLRRNASSVQKISMYEKELQTLRKIMRSYIVQIDSLNTKNRELISENLKVKYELDSVSTDYDSLSKHSDMLSSKVALAKKLSAKNIIPEGLNDRSKVKDKVKKIAKLRVCATIRENAVADAGKKMKYLVITRPDEVILSNPDAEMFNIGEEQKVYTARRELQYDNEDIDICIYWNNKQEELIEGKYKVQLFAEGHEIGTSVFELQ